MSTRRRSWWSCLLCLLVVLSATACAGSQDESALAAAQAYAAALAEGDGDGACDVLAPNVRSELEHSSGKACNQAILDEGVVTDVRPWRCRCTAPAPRCASRMTPSSWAATRMGGA